MTEADVVAMAEKRKGWSRGRAEAVVRELMQGGKWGLDQLFIGFQANFFCEYCGRDLLESADSYKLWEMDHIIPGEGDDSSNLALACLPCNCKFKNRWWRPSGNVGSGDRDGLVAEVKKYVAQRRQETDREVAALKEKLR
jgi:hypothetical protein